MQISSRIAPATALFFGLSVLTGAHASPRVLATIKPIHSLVAAVMKGVGTPDLLIQGAQSEHSYALKPSDAGKIGQAQIVFEVGPDLETYLARSLATLARKAKIVVLERVPGVRLLPARHGGLWENGNNPDEGPTDPHIWLDPENAIAMARAIAAALSQIDPAHAAAYSANRDREATQIAKEEARLRNALASVHGHPYLVFHDAYLYFEHRFGLTPVGAVTVAPERPVGPRRIEMLRAEILKGNVICVFREPQFSPRLIDTLVDGSSAKIGILDPLGATLAPGPDLYQKLLRGLSDSLTECLR
jgi:zinc transport system substrate-binding protein